MYERPTPHLPLLKTALENYANLQKLIQLNTMESCVSWKIIKFADYRKGSNR